MKPQSQLVKKKEKMRAKQQARMRAEQQAQIRAKQQAESQRMYIPAIIEQIERLISDIENMKERIYSFYDEISSNQKDKPQESNKTNIDIIEKQLNELNEFYRKMNTYKDELEKYKNTLQNEANKYRNIDIKVQVIVKKIQYIFEEINMIFNVIIDFYKHNDISSIIKRYNLNRQSPSKRRNFGGGNNSYIFCEVINCLIRPKDLSSYFKSHGKYDLYNNNVISKLQQLIKAKCNVQLMGYYTTANQRKAIELFEKELNDIKGLKNIPITYINETSNEDNIETFIATFQNIDKNNSFIIGESLDIEQISDVKYVSSMNYFFDDEITVDKNKFSQFKKISVPTIIMLSGFPGSGKSTISKEFTEMNYKLIDGDKLSSIKMMNQVLELMKKKESIIIDGTFLTKKSRKTYIDMIKNESEEYDILMIEVTTDSFESFVRNVKRSRDKKSGRNMIPLKVYQDFLKKYQSPMLNEGFTAIHQYPKKTSYGGYLRKLEDADQQLHKYLLKKVSVKYHV